MPHKTLLGPILAGMIAVSDLAFAQAPPRIVQHLMDAVQDLVPEVNSQRVVPSPKAGEPVAVLTARIRADIVQRRVRQASERARTFAGGLVAGVVTTEDRGTKLSIRGASGSEVGFLLFVASGRDLRIEVYSVEQAPPDPGELPVMPMEPPPVMRVFPLQE